MSLLESHCISLLLTHYIGILNIHMDTPTEILYTVLLGVVQYFGAKQLLFLRSQGHLMCFKAALTPLIKMG